MSSYAYKVGLRRCPSVHEVWFWLKMVLTPGRRKWLRRAGSSTGFRAWCQVSNAADPDSLKKRSCCCLCAFLASNSPTVGALKASLFSTSHLADPIWQNCWCRVYFPPLTIKPCRVNNLFNSEPKPLPWGIVCHLSHLNDSYIYIFAYVVPCWKS